MISRLINTLASTQTNILFLTLSVLGILAFCVLANYSLLIPMVLLFMGFHLYFHQKASLKSFLNLGLLITLNIFMVNSIHSYHLMPGLAAPVASIAMLTMLLFNDLELAFVISFINSLLAGMIMKTGYEVMLIFFLGGLMGAYSLRGARTRGHLIVSGMYVSVINILALLLITNNFSLFADGQYLRHFLYPLLANGFICAFIVASLSKVFEFLFNVVTNYTLLELSDFNQPLLKRMILEAPGTYQHSLVVSTLAENAADIIGANSLLARVGAYYHDIGKMVKPEYFTENQIMERNRHDDIEPSMSRLVIQSHVKEGVELAKRSHLNQKIIDFITQHHGTSMMHYFYQRALEEAPEKEGVFEDDFRYPGPKPQTKESAIILLADSAEAAVRSLDEHTPTRIEETVKKVVNNKFIDGQLDECNLTLKEINKISAAFVRNLNSIYHARVKYPDKKNGNSNK
ncbi:MAG: HDIG domain-containing protein, partial [Candidatus Omnitrophica bacterium]|nr:HDIG domain-containing protein [Candidatus Omnitrophota bacterium]